MGLGACVEDILELVYEAASSRPTAAQLKDVIWIGDSLTPSRDAFQKRYAVRLATRWRWRNEARSMLALSRCVD